MEEWKTQRSVDKGGEVAAKQRESYCPERRGERREERALTGLEE
jgi:hypothetical protein